MNIHLAKFAVVAVKRWQTTKYFSHSNLFCVDLRWLGFHPENFVSALCQNNVPALGMLKNYNLQFASNCCGSFSFRNAVYGMRYRIQKKLFVPSPNSGRFSRYTLFARINVFFCLLVCLFLFFWGVLLFLSIQIYCRKSLILHLE